MCNNGCCGSKQQPKLKSSLSTQNIFTPTESPVDCIPLNDCLPKLMPLKSTNLVEILKQELLLDFNEDEENQLCPTDFNTQNLCDNSQGAPLCCVGNCYPDNSYYQSYNTGNYCYPGCYTPYCYYGQCSTTPACIDSNYNPTETYYPNTTDVCGNYTVPLVDDSANLKSNCDYCCYAPSQPKSESEDECCIFDNFETVNNNPYKHITDYHLKQSLNKTKSRLCKKKKQFKIACCYPSKLGYRKSKKCDNCTVKLQQNIGRLNSGFCPRKKMSDNVDHCSVQVAVRIRPQNPRELIDMCRICTTVTKGEPQIVIGQDKAFTFDFVFDMDSIQDEIYGSCVNNLVEGALNGFNATVLAYGQTGSGKTYTMGTGFERELDDKYDGIIPRAVHHIFSAIAEQQMKTNDNAISEYSIAVQFMELYNEDIIDLLNPYKKGNPFKIHEDTNGEITINGITIKSIKTPQDALKYLQQGALARTTASTKMNDQSSRSHAVFTILIKRQTQISDNDNCGISEGDLQIFTSKFHFVDLAGSERLKRTMATGERAREGISINCGLLALGNCISALGDSSRKASHVPYRDSKLTRLLQDSLGGNSRTLMIACVSPSDRDFMETLNTLKYANRARNIKNRVQINYDQNSRTVVQLRREIAALQMELFEYKQGKRHTDAEGNSCLSDTYYENKMLMDENKRLQQRIKAMQETINILTEKNTKLLFEKTSQGWLVTTTTTDETVTEMVTGYLREIEDLQAKLIESTEMYQQLKNTKNSLQNKDVIFEDAEDLITLAKLEVEKEKEILLSRSLSSGIQESNIANPERTNNEICEVDESDSDSENNYLAQEMEMDLNDVNSDIEIKTKLIEQLERSQESLKLMRLHYEEKLKLLNGKITNTQKERDEVLANMGSNPNNNQPNDKIKKVREEYEKKIKDMQQELRSLQNVHREHNRQQRDMQAQEIKLNNLRSELADLKAHKTTLMRKINDQAKRHQEQTQRKEKEIKQLRKVQRKQETTVKTLQAKMHAKEQVLKRKSEEVSALRRNQQRLSQKAAGRIKDKKNLFNPRMARQQWENINRVITLNSRNKQAIMQLDKELDRLLSERESLSHELAGIRVNEDKFKNNDLANEEDTIKANLNYIQNNIEHVQHAIMELEENNNGVQTLKDFIASIQTIEEAKYLIDRLTDNAIVLNCDSSMNQANMLEQEAMFKEVQQESIIQQQLLQYFLAQNNDVQISDLFDSLNIPGIKGRLAEKNCLSDSQKSLISNGTYDIPFEGSALLTSSLKYRSRSDSPSPTPTVDILNDKNDKVRKRTAQAQDLLFGGRDENQYESDTMTSSHTQQKSRNLMRVPSAPDPMRGMDATATQQSPQSPRSIRRRISNKGSPETTEDKSFTSSYNRKMIPREECLNTNGDVFSRLVTGNQEPAPGGYISKITGKVKVGVPLHCTHQVVGHNNAVLSIKVTNDTLYTAAADKTVKIWDICQGKAVHCLSMHSGPVTSVENIPFTDVVFSASGSYVRVWDLISSNSKPIKTLASTGQIMSGVNNMSGLITGESSITAMCLGTMGNLYVAASDKVRIWELKSFMCIGKLSGGHQAAVMCVTAWKGAAEKEETDFVATGSKDHYVKVFEVYKNGGTVYPLINLEPPHYDGVQALCVAPGVRGANAELFSGSRDSGIKQWNLKSGELKQSFNNVHKGWVSGMAISGDVLLSSCRGGLLRLWNVQSSESIADVKTEQVINDIAVASEKVYTATSEGMVLIWRLKNLFRQNLTLSS